MHLRTLALENIRNIGGAQLSPGPRLNILHGDNGAGKTTVLEAIVLLAKGRSFRTGPLTSLIGPHQDFFRIITDLNLDDGQHHRLGVERRRDGWQGRLNGEDLKQVTSAAHLLPLVLMEPNSHLLVSGGPDFRRRFLDWTVFHVKRDFLIEWRRYARALKQRNAALRSRDIGLVKSMDPQVIQLGESLTAQRQAVFERLQPAIVETLQTLSPSLGTPGLEFRPGWSESSLADALSAGLDGDLDLGQTRRGPHRADLSFRVRGKAVRDRLSRGEHKILAAAALLAQGQVFSEIGHTPLVLLDDLASEFDERHLAEVVTVVNRLGAQQFITGTDKRAYTQLDLAETRVFHVKQGVISTIDA